MAILGIDLGTTNSLACVWKDGKPELVKNSLGELLTPSVVCLDKEGNLAVGAVAKEQLITDPEDTAAPDPAPEAPPAPAPADPPPKAITLEEVRAVLAERSHDGYTDQVRGLAPEVRGRETQRCGPQALRRSAEGCGGAGPCHLTAMLSSPPPAPTAG